MRINNIFSKKTVEFNDIFYQPKKPTLFSKLKKKLLPSSMIFGGGLILGLGVYLGGSAIYHAGSWLIQFISSINFDFLSTIDKSITNSKRNDEFNSIMDLMSAISYLLGVSLCLKSAMKFKEFSEDGRGRLSEVLTTLIVAGLLMALPNFLTTASYTTFSNTAPSLEHNELSKNTK